MKTFKEHFLTEAPHVDFGEIDGNEVFVDFYSEKNPLWVKELIKIFSGDAITDSQKNLFKIDTKHERDQITKILVKDPFFILALSKGVENLSQSDRRRFKFVIPQSIQDKMK